MRNTRLPVGGENVFQKIKKVRRAAEERGVKIINLSIGQPTGPAILIARKTCSHVVTSCRQDIHEYQDNGCLPCPDFSKRFVKAHTVTGVELRDDVAFLPIPGTKPMLPLIMLACGAADPDGGAIMVSGMTNPGYGVPATWAGYIGNTVNYSALKTNPENGFCFSEKDIPEGTELVMMNYPHNPSGAISTREYLRGICAYCEENDIRLFNDAAYAVLADAEHCTLADVAVDFPELSWAEAFSASKALNFTGWRIGAIVGSPDFVADIATIKGNTDSGFFAPAAIGILSAFEELEGMMEIKNISKTYKTRRDLLIKTLSDYGMVPTIIPKAGFFCLFKSPKKAFGIDIQNAEHFNNLMIEKTGVLGVPFHPYIRYAVVGDVEAMLPDIEKAFAEAQVSY
jgi:LL-diaminopimelate aminotransferase